MTSHESTSAWQRLMALGERSSDWRVSLWKTPSTEEQAAILLYRYEGHAKLALLLAAKKLGESMGDEIETLAEGEQHGGYWMEVIRILVGALTVPERRLT